MAYTFDGPNKLIILSTDTTSFDVKDMYSSWKTWFVTDDNAKFLPAFRVIGGDPTTGGNSITPYFFLDNGWKVRPQEASHTLNVSGILLTIDDTDPFVDTIGNWRITVKSIVPIYAESTLATVDNITIDSTAIANDVWNHTNRSVNITSVNGVNVTSINDFKTDLGAIPASVWSYVSRELTVAAGLTIDQETKLDTIINKLNSNLNADIKAVNGTVVTDINDFKDGTVSVDASQIWNYPSRSLTIAPDVDLSSIPLDVWSYVSRELTVAAGLTPTQETTLNSILTKLNGSLDANVKSIQGVNVTSINDFKTDISGLPTLIWNHNNRELTVPSGLTLAQEAKIDALPSYVWSYNTRNLTEGVNAILDVDVKSHLMTLSNYNDTGINAKLDSIETKTTNINNSIISTETKIDALNILFDSIPQLSEIRNELVDVQFGALEIKNNQMFIKDRHNNVISVFNLFDANGNPTMTSVYRREVVV